MDLSDRLRKLGLRDQKISRLEPTLSLLTIAEEKAVEGIPDLVPMFRDLRGALLRKHGLPMLRCPYGSVYLIRRRGSGRIKVGYALEPLHRLVALSVGSDEQLDLYACSRADPEMEDLLKFQLRSSRIRGEWFEMNAAGFAFMAGAPNLWCSRDFTKASDDDLPNALHSNREVVAAVRNLWRSMNHVQRRRTWRAANAVRLGILRYLLYDTMVKPPNVCSIVGAMLERMGQIRKTDLAIIDAKIAAFRLFDNIRGV